jgi:hypothetical protein
MDIAQLKQNQLDLLNGLKEKLKNPSFDLDVWINLANNALKSIYPDRNINILRTRFNLQEPYARRELAQLIQGYIEEIEKIGPIVLNDNKSSGNIYISQNVNLNIVVESLREELSGSQIRELKEAFDSGKSTKEKKSKLLDKLKEFGTDLTAKVLSNLLSNEKLWSSLNL